MVSSIVPDGFAVLLVVLLVVFADRPRAARTKVDHFKAVFSSGRWQAHCRERDEQRGYPHFHRARTKRVGTCRSACAVSPSVYRVSPHRRWVEWVCLRTAGTAGRVGLVRTDVPSASTPPARGLATTHLRRDPLRRDLSTVRLARARASCMAPAIPTTACSTARSLERSRESRRSVDSWRRVQTFHDDGGDSVRADCRCRSKYNQAPEYFEN